MTAPILVVGATGTVGAAVERELRAAGLPMRAGVRRCRVGAAGADDVALDLTAPATWPGAFDGVRTMFLLRPPALGNARRDVLPAVAAAREAGVEHVVFLSLQGADRIRVVPHHAIESWLRTSGLGWTFVRPSFFCQNLSTTHAGDVRDRSEVVVPAGNGRTAFVDALDVAAVAARALADPVAHRGKAWTVTGPDALTYSEVARLLTAELGREIRYRSPGLARYARHAHSALGMAPGMIAVTAAIYTTARLGLADSLTSDVQTVLGRPPIAFREFAHRERAIWARD